MTEFAVTVIGPDRAGTVTGLTIKQSVLVVEADVPPATELAGQLGPVAAELGADVSLEPAVLPDRPRGEPISPIVSSMPQARDQRKAYH